MLSGGGDSTALFFLLQQAGHSFSCLHFQHDSPGDFALLSLEFCQRLCQDHKVALEVRQAQAGGLTRQGDLSWEAAASLLRYRELAGREGLFLTAHTADDQAETVLMRLFDGAGLAGLAGIRSRRGERVDRPLLSFRRRALREYLQALEQPWIRDPTNRDGNDRARLRHGILPQLERLYPSLVATLGRTALTLAADEQALTGMARSWLVEAARQGDHWPLSELRALPPAVRHRIFRELWKQTSDGSRRPLGGVFRDCERLVMQAHDDRLVPFPGGCRLRKIGDWLWLEPPTEEAPWRLPLDKSLSQPLRTASWTVLPPNWEAPDADESEIRLPLPAGVFGGEEQYELRTRLPGDTFAGRSLKKRLAATGHPPWVRDRWPLLTCRDQVVAVPGLSDGEDVGAGWLLFRPACWRWRLGGER